MASRKPTTPKQLRAAKARVLPSISDVHIDAGRGIAELIARGDSGDKAALSELYARAAAWARNGGTPIPEPLGTWIADRLQSVAKAIRNRTDSDIGRTVGRSRGGGRELPEELAVALKVQRSGVKGRTPKAKTAELAKMRAHEVLHFMTSENLLPEQAIRRVIEYNSTKKMPVPAEFKTYSAAWLSYGDGLMREAGVEFADPKKRKQRK